jgi:hypothetical protein
MSEPPLGGKPPTISRPNASASEGVVRILRYWHGSRNRIKVDDID